MKEQLPGANINQIQKKYAPNRYFNHLVNPSFQGVNKLFVLSFENKDDRTSHSTYYLPKVEIKDYMLWLTVKTFLIIQINRELKTYENIGKIATGKGDDYTTCSLLDYSYFLKNCKMIAVDLSKQQVLDANPRAN